LRIAINMDTFQVYLTIMEIYFYFYRINCIRKYITKVIINDCLVNFIIKCKFIFKSNFLFLWILLFFSIWTKNSRYSIINLHFPLYYYIIFGKRILNILISTFITQKITFCFYYCVRMRLLLFFFLILWRFKM